MAEEDTVAEEAASNPTEEANKDNKSERAGVENLRVLENIDVGLTVKWVVQK